MRGILYGIGVGPGDAELLTIKALRCIEKSQVIILPAEPKEDCAAYRIVKEVYPGLEEKELVCLPFPMSKDREKQEEAHRRIYKRIAGYLKKGDTVAFLTIGDPCIYATYQYIRRMVLADGGTAEVINGVPSFCAAAGALGISLGDGGEEIHIIPGSYDIADTMKLKGTRVYMKTGKQLAKLKEALQKQERERLIEVYSVENCGMENERKTVGAASLDPSSGYFTVVIAKQAREPETEKKEPSYRFFENQSCKYYPCHEGMGELNCLFCFCPLYEREHCPGKPEYLEQDGGKIKSCMNCTFPHQAENYEVMMRFLRKPQ